MNPSPTTNPSPVVYMIHLQDFMKIGYTTNLQSRIHQIQAGSPFKFEIARIIENCQPIHEKWLHNRFRSLHIQGEWFKFSDEMLTVKLPTDIFSYRAGLNRRPRKPRV